MTDDAIITTGGLTKRFGAFTAVDALSIHVRRGSIFAFLGANGSGKSTTIRMLIGLLTPTAGAITVDGIDVVQAPRRVRDRIGYMGQKVSLYSGLTLRENAEFYGGLFGLEGAALGRRWDALAERFTLGAVDRERTEELPAGIRQRAGLALATLHEPRLLFLDEPTAGVDVLSRARFWEAIEDEAAAGRTVFVTTHFLEEIEHCHWVACLHQGRLVADDTPSALRARYGVGFRVTARGAARAAVARTVTGHIDETADSLTITTPEVSPEALSHLAALTEAQVTITPPSWNDVFRRVLTEASAA